MKTTCFIKIKLVSYWKFNTYLHILQRSESERPRGVPPWIRVVGSLSKSLFLVSCRFLDAYRAQNLTFWALTTGNEPLNGIVPVNRFNSMGWTPMSHREWIGGHMGPRLRASEHNATLLFAIDDQRIVLPWWMKMVKLFSLLPLIHAGKHSTESLL